MKWSVWGVSPHSSGVGDFTLSGDDTAQPAGQSPGAARLAAGAVRLLRVRKLTDENQGRTSHVDAQPRPAPWRRVAVCVGAVLLLAACGGAPPPAQQAQVAAGGAAAGQPANLDDARAQLDQYLSEQGAQQGPAAPGPQAPGTTGAAAPAQADTGGDVDGTTASAPRTPNTATRKSTGSPAPRSGKGAANEPAAPPPADDDLPDDVGTFKIAASVDPVCVRPGSSTTLSVATEPHAGVGYHAFYADGKGGAEPPYGGGYGGNDGAVADAAGQYSDEWTVAPNAPSGPGRVDVLVGHEGAFKQISIDFAVADAVTGTCAP